MTFTQLIVTATVFIIIIALNAIPRVGYLISTVFIAAFFMFEAAVLNPAQGTFYSIMAVLAIIFAAVLHVAPKDLGSARFAGASFTGTMFVLLEVAVGVVLVFFIWALARPAGGAASVIGVPKLLAVSGGVKSAFAPALLGSLGYLENRFFLPFINILSGMVLPVLGMTGNVALLLAGGIVLVSFGLFHFAVLGVNGIVFAMVVMGVWVFINSSPVGEHPTSISHFLHNALIGLGAGLVIAT